MRIFIRYWEKRLPDGTEVFLCRQLQVAKSPEPGHFDTAGNTWAAPDERPRSRGPARPQDANGEGSDEDVGRELALGRGRGEVMGEECAKCGRCLSSDDQSVWRCCGTSLCFACQIKTDLALLQKAAKTAERRALGMVIYRCEEWLEEEEEDPRPKGILVFFDQGGIPVMHVPGLLPETAPVAGTIVGVPGGVEYRLDKGSWQQDSGIRFEAGTEIEWRELPT